MLVCGRVCGKAGAEAPIFQLCTLPSSPDHGFRAEEGTVREGAEYRWVVDPLDGTTNFAHGLPWFAVSIALEHQGTVIVGVVYHPPLDEIFMAEQGKGAWVIA